MPRVLCLALALFSLPLAAAPLWSTEALDDENFDVWHMPGDDFKIYCRQPCQAEDADIQAYYLDFRGLLPALVEWHGIDVIDELKPVELHLNTSKVCPSAGQSAGYAKVGHHRGWENRRGVACLFEAERDRPLRENMHVLSLHEYAHIILFERHRWSYEYFTYWSSWAIADPSSPMADPCSESYAANDFTLPVHILCRDYGLRQHHVRDALIELDQRFRDRSGFYHLHTDGGHTTSLAELRALLDQALGADTSPAFMAGGWEHEHIGMEFEVGFQGKEFSGLQDQIRITVPEGALPDTRRLRIDKPGFSPGFLPPSHSPHLFAIVPDGANDSIQAERIHFEQPLELAISPQPFYLDDRPLSDYQLLELRLYPGSPAQWQVVPESSYDPGSGMLSGLIHASGHYAYGPRFQAPAGMYFDPAVSGHGFDIQMSGDQVMVVFFTYDQAGRPFWMLGHAPLGNVEGRGVSAVQMDLYLFQNLHRGSDPVGSRKGHLTLQFTGGWDARGWNIRALADLQVDGITNGEQRLNLEALPFGQTNATELQVTGHWFNPNDSGWGLTVDRKADIEVVVAYFYDASGHPRWALGNRSLDQEAIELMIFEGFCISCEVIEPVPTVAGTITLNFEPSGRLGHTDLDVAWPANASQRWTRLEAGIVPLSNPPAFRKGPP